MNKRFKYECIPVRNIHEAHVLILDEMFVNGSVPCLMYDLDFTLTESPTALQTIAPIVSHLMDQSRIFPPENISAVVRMSEILEGRVAVVTNRVDTRLAQLTFNSSRVLRRLNVELIDLRYKVPIFQGLSKQFPSERKLANLAAWISAMPKELTHIVSIADYNFPFTSDEGMLKKLFELTGRDLSCRQYLVKP